ncbi:MAG: formate transporter [Bdellovibrionaceae bacterium]|nr:formate transporter [Pseudobdellovibrionaceae bacterium]
MATQDLNLEKRTHTRSEEREQEDRFYTPVIVKRIDQSVRHPDDTLQKAIHEGLRQHDRTTTSLFLSAIAAGMILGFAAMAVSVGAQIPGEIATAVDRRLAMAILYPFGFIVCIMSGTQLFTEQTATAIYPFLDRKIGVLSLLRVWLVVLAGNLLGALVSSYLISSSDPVILAHDGYNYIAKHLLEFSSPQLFLSAVLAGWLMAQGGWLIVATPPASSQIVCIYVVTFIIGIGGLHHSIAGAAEAFCYAFLNEGSDWGAVMKFVAVASLGNLLGGSLFVGVLNYGHIKST